MQLLCSAFDQLVYCIRLDLKLLLIQHRDRAVVQRNMMAILIVIHSPFILVVLQVLLEEVKTLISEHSFVLFPAFHYCQQFKMASHVRGLVDSLVLLLYLLSLEDLALFRKSTVNAMKVRLANAELKLFHFGINFIKVAGNVEYNGEILQDAVDVIPLSRLFVYSHVIDVEILQGSNMVVGSLISPEINRIQGDQNVRALIHLYFETYFVDPHIDHVVLPQFLLYIFSLSQFCFL